MRISDWSSDVCSSDLKGDAVLAVRLTGKVLAVTGGERARSMTIDTDGDGSVDAIVQLGPVVRGTALRDALGTRTFDHFARPLAYPRSSRMPNAPAARRARNGPHAIPPAPGPPASGDTRP